MTMCIIPSAVGTENQVASDNSAKIGLKEDKNVLEVNAASKKKKVKAKTKKATKKVKATKKTYKKKVKVTKKTYKKTYKKAKVKYTKVRVKYRYKGKWKYKWVYKKSYSSVSAYSTTKTVNTPTSSSGSWSNDPTLDAIMRSGSRFGYSSAYHTGADIANHGAGDCWAMSDYLNSKFRAAGYNSRIIQYATSYSSRHRSVQVFLNGAWQTVPYRSYGYNYLFV
jgi:hypothetical protein